MLKNNEYSATFQSKFKGNGWKLTFEYVASRLWAIGSCSLIVRVSVVLGTTLIGRGDWSFDNQSESEIRLRDQMLPVGSNHLLI